MTRHLGLPLHLYPFRHKGEVCYVLSFRNARLSEDDIVSMEPAEMLALIQKLRDLVLASDQPSPHVAIAGIVGTRFLALSTDYWMQTIQTDIDGWASGGGNMPKMSAASIESNFFRDYMTLNSYCSFRPMSDFITSNQGGTGYGLDPEVYDWREYERRGWLT